MNDSCARTRAYSGPRWPSMANGQENMAFLIGCHWPSMTIEGHRVPTSIGCQIISIGCHWPSMKKPTFLRGFIIGCQTTQSVRARESWGENPKTRHHPPPATHAGPFGRLEKPSQQKRKTPEFFLPLTFSNAFPRSIGARGCEEIPRHLIPQQALCLRMSCIVNIVVATKPRYIFWGNAGV
jgi:hypothetical protein